MAKKEDLKKNLVKFEHPPDYQAAVNKVKEEFLNLDKVKLGEKFIVAKQVKDDLEEQVGILNLELEAINQLMIDQLDEEGIKSFQLLDGTTIFQKASVYPSVQDKEAFYTWVDRQGMEDMYSVNYQTMRGMIKEMMEKGEELPPGVAVFLKTSIQKRAGKA